MTLRDCESWVYSTGATDYVSAGRLVSESSATIGSGGPNGDPYLALDPYNGGNAARRVISGGPFTTLIHGCRFYLTAGATGEIWFDDRVNGVQQVTLVLNPGAGQVSAYRGTDSGTLLGSSATGVFAASAWTFLEASVTVGSGTSGSMVVKINGTVVLTLASINTQNSARAAIDSTTWKASGSNTTHFNIAHCYWVDTAGSANNSFLGDVRVAGLVATADGDQTDFINQWPIGYANANGTPFAASANFVYALPAIAALVSGTIPYVSVFVATGFTGNIKAALYSAAGALIASTNALSNPGSGENDLSFSSPPSVTAATSYILAVISDTAFSLDQDSGSVTCQALARSYGSGFPSSLSGSSGFSGEIDLWAPIQQSTTLNYQAVSEPSAFGDAAYITASVVNNFELYKVTGSFGVSAVLGVQASIVTRKTSAGPRSLAPIIKSGGTIGVGTSTAASISWSTISGIFETDPSTSNPFSAAALSNIQVGPKITA